MLVSLLWDQDAEANGMSDTQLGVLTKGTMYVLPLALSISGDADFSTELR